MRPTRIDGRVRVKAAAGYAAALAVLLGAGLVGCDTSSDGGTLEPPALDPSGSYMQSRTAVVDGCGLLDRTERVLWTLQGNLLTAVGEACQSVELPLDGTVATNTRTETVDVDGFGCELLATINTELVFDSSGSYAGTVQYVGNLLGTCNGGCNSTFDITGSLCSGSGGCPPTCLGP